MFKKIEGWIINILLKAKIGEVIAKLFAGIKGGKTYIALALVIAIKFCIYAGFIPNIYIDVANEIVNALYGVSAVSFGDKIRRYWEAFDKTANEVIKNG